jgi:hypothetical protein
MPSHARNLHFAAASKLQIPQFAQTTIKEFLWKGTSSLVPLKAIRIRL